MRTKKEILTEIKKVSTAKRNAERKRTRCLERLAELEQELAEVKEAADETE